MSGGEWSYPVLWFYPNGEFSIIEDDARMYLGDKKNVRSEVYTSSQFVDANLGHWRVTGAEFESYRPRFSEWPRYLFARPGRIRLKTSFLGKRSLAEVAELLYTALDDDVELTEYERKDLKARVGSASEYGDLITSLEEALA